MGDPPKTVPSPTRVPFSTYQTMGVPSGTGEPCESVTVAVTSTVWPEFTSSEPVEPTSVMVIGRSSMVVLASASSIAAVTSCPSAW